MTEGFLFTEGPDNGLATWVGGRPEIAVFSGDLKTADRDIRRVQTFRCPRCGYLESYAKESRR